jgi:hypothetical protein
MEFEMNWRLELICRHRDLLSHDPSFPGINFGTMFMPEGWREIIERAVRRLQALADESGIPIRIVRMTRLNGILRIRCTPDVLPDQFRNRRKEIFELAEMRSALSCETCGGAAYAFKLGDETFTRCLDHAVGRLVARRSDFDDFEVTWKWRGIHMVRSYRKYDRARDVFVELDVRNGRSGSDAPVKLQPRRGLVSSGAQADREGQR